MERVILCPSMMCADFDNLGDEVKKLNEAGADIFHIDVMDGNFVPNYGMGPQDIKAIRRNTESEIDVHLMTNKSSEYLELFKDLGVNIVYVHSENDPHISRTLNKIKTLGMKVGLAINPGTSVETIEPLFNLVDILLVMTVNPGFAGQDYLYFVDDKIKKLSSLKNKYGYKIFVDGAISPERIKNLKNFGVEGFILGTSSLFGKEKTYKEIFEKLRSL